MYGSSAGHPNIAYPKITASSKRAEPRGAFIPGGAKRRKRRPRNLIRKANQQHSDARIGKHLFARCGSGENARRPRERERERERELETQAKTGEASDPRQATRRQVEVKVPHKARPEPTSHAIDFCARRKNKDAIDESLKDMRMRNNYYRPPAAKAYSTEESKRRLQEQCQYGGGKGLPDEFLHPVGPTPSSLRVEAKERERVAKAWRSKRGEAEPAAHRPPPPPDVRLELVETLNSEISDRRTFLEQMSKLGQGQNDTTRRIEHEIDCRHHELQKALAKAGAPS